jgi:hypothetical protein
MNTKNSQVIFSSRLESLSFLLFTTYWKSTDLYKLLLFMSLVIYSVSSFSCGGCTCFCTMQDLATDSNNLQHKKIKIGSHGVMYQSFNTSVSWPVTSTDLQYLFLGVIHLMPRLRMHRVIPPLPHLHCFVMYRNIFTIHVNAFLHSVNI